MAAPDPSFGPQPSWVSIYDGPDSSADRNTEIARSPDGSRVFVTGWATEHHHRYATVAYDASTGAQLWAAIFGGSHNKSQAYGEAVSPDGSRLFVTGQTQHAGTGNPDVGTVAYDAATGTQLWSARFDGSAHDYDVAGLVVVSLDGKFVYVGGTTTSVDTGWDYLVIAYDASTGKRAWTNRFDDGPRDLLSAMRLSPDGTTLFGTGETGDFGSIADTTLTYDGSDGDVKWESQYSDPAGVQAYDLATSPDGKRVFVVGMVGSIPSVGLFIAYAAGDGSQRWVTTFDGPTDETSVTRAVVAPDGSMLYGGGYVGLGDDALAIAVRTSDGKRMWTSLFDGPAHLRDTTRKLVLLGAGSKLATVDFSETKNDADIATVVYNTSDGSLVWSAAYDGGSYDYGAGITATPDGSSVLVSGSTKSADPSGWDYVTIAYPV